MNILTLLDITDLLLIGILIAQVLIYLRMPKPDNAFKRRQRRKRIDKIIAKVKRA